MTMELGLRLLAAAAAVAVGRAGKRASVVMSGLLSGFAAFGWGPGPWPGPLAAGLSVLALTALAAAALLPLRNPITGDAVISGALFGLPAAAAAAIANRGGGALSAFAAALVVLSAISFFSAESLRATADAGRRRTAIFVSALLLPAALGAAAAVAGPAARWAAAALFGVVGAGLLSWAPAILAERGRVRRELGDEVRLGVLPPEDAVALELPWRRSFEKRFGRPDERREYVRSALLLAVARARQRSRTGEAERLRQLEVLTFRTRIRRTLEARALRDRRADSLELPVVGPAPDRSGRAG